MSAIPVSAQVASSASASASAAASSSVAASASASSTEVCKACLHLESAQRARQQRAEDRLRSSSSAARSSPSDLTRQGSPDSMATTDSNTTDSSADDEGDDGSRSEDEEEQNRLLQDEIIDHHPHSRACTYTSNLPLPFDPLAPFARLLDTPKSTGVPSVSFSGCGAFYPYLFGVACYLQDHFDLGGVHFLGTSGGCLPALTLACGLDMREAFFEKWNNRVIEDSQQSRLQGYFSFISTCHKHAHEYFPSDIHSRANGRLHLSTTRVHTRPSEGWSFRNALAALTGGVRILQNERVSHWHSKSDLIDSVAASTYIPILDGQGLLKRWRNRWYLDGGLTDNQPILDEETIQLNPFMWTPANLLTKASFIYIRLSNEWHAALFKAGYDDAVKFGQSTFAHLPRKDPKDVDRRPIIPPDLAERIKIQQMERDEAVSRATTDLEWRPLIV